MPSRWARAPLCGNSSWNKVKWQLFETPHLEVLQNPSDDARAMRLGFFDSATHPALRAPLSERGWRGSATFNDHLPIIDNQNDVSAHPLSERGEGTASGSSDSEAVNENVGRGVSHCQAQNVKCVPKPNIVKNAVSTPIIANRLHISRIWVNAKVAYNLLYVRCFEGPSSVDVRLLSAWCPLVVRF